MPFLVDDADLHRTHGYRVMPYQLPEQLSCTKHVTSAVSTSEHNGFDTKCGPHEFSSQNSLFGFVFLSLVLPEHS